MNDTLDRNVQEEWMALKNLFHQGRPQDDVGVDLQKVIQTYPFRISDHLQNYFPSFSTAVWQQLLPTEKELDETVLEDDPLWEEKQSPIPFLVHRYPDRVLLLVTDQCAMYCRFCLRKRRVGKKGTLPKENFLAIIEYLKAHSGIREVIFSGGDPFMVSDDELEWMMGKIRSISHIKIIRFHTRMLLANPLRMTPSLVEMLKSYAPIYLITHFNVPEEITPESQLAISQLADAGIVLANQSVLLRGSNDSPEVLSTLWRTLAEIRVRPYYLHHPDPIAGTAHFRMSIQEGLTIYRMAEKISGICVPRYVLDVPGGKGKITLHEGLIVAHDKTHTHLRLPDGSIFLYPN